MSDRTHPLKDKWTLMYTPPVTKEMVQKDYDNDWEKAAEAVLKTVDDISTIEELWSTFNSIPKPHQLPPNDFLILTRNGIKPKFECFPDGSRLCIQVPENNSTKLVDTSLMAILGEQVRSATEDKPVIDVIRITHKPGFKGNDNVVLELWFHGEANMTPLETFFNTVFKEQDCGMYKMFEKKIA